MSSPVVECVSNFSGSRRPEVVDQSQEAVATVPGAYVLDLHSNLDDNRSVITYAGSPAEVAEAASQAVARAAAAGVQEAETNAV